MAQPIIVQGGGSSSAGILLLLVAIVGLLALFSGNLDRAIAAIAGPAGGPAGIGGSVTATPAGGLAAGRYGQPVPAARSGAGGGERAL